MEQLSFWRESAARRSWNGLTAFLGKHNKVVTVLSAFIVFWSFIIKDAWDEHLKELAGTVAAARDRARDSENFDYTLDYLRATLEQLDLLKRKLVDNENVKEKTSAQLEVGFVNQVEDAIFADLDEVDSLAKVLPHPDHYLGEVKRLRDLHGKYGLELTRLDTLANLNKERTPAEEQQLVAIGKQSSQILSSADRLRMQAIHEAEAVRDWNERYHAICRRISYWLFACGWPLGLLSNLAGAKSSIPE